MTYQSKKGPIKSEERAMARAMPIVEGERNATLELMKRLKGGATFGMLLLDDPKHPMSELVRERWTEISNLTGDRFVLFSLDRPADWTENYKRYWRNKLGKQFEQTWRDWQEAPEPGAAYTYLRLFKPPLTPQQVPCLVLFTDPEERQAVVRPIPNWDKESLFALLKGITAVVQESADLPAEKQLEWLREKLTSPGARFLSAAGHVGSKALDYFKQHPALVTSTAVSVVLALSGAGVFSLPPVAVSVLKVLKDTLSGAKSG